MGLGISVGRLADLLVNDEEGGEWFREDLAKLNRLLTTAGLAVHVEPEDTETANISTFGYSGLHFLRRCAAHLQYAGKLPPPLDLSEEPVKDLLYIRYAEAFDAENVGAPAGAFAAPSDRAFDHLIMHDDAEGFYLPQRFPQVLIAADQAYGWVGSCHTLIDECERVAAALALPAELLADGESPVFEDAIRSPKPSNGVFGSLFKRKRTDPVWRAHPVAAMMCAKLHQMANHSIRTGALMVFE